MTLDYFDTRPLQERALQVLQFKLDVLWSMNDAMALRYGVPLGLPSPAERERGRG